MGQYTNKTFQFGLISEKGQSSKIVIVLFFSFSLHSSAPELTLDWRTGQIHE